MKDLVLRGRLLQPSAVNVGPLRVIAGDEPFVGHDLHDLGSSGVAGGAVFAEEVIDLPHRAGAALPEDAEDRKFAVGGMRQWLVVGHEPFLSPPITPVQGRGNYELVLILRINS